MFNFLADKTIKGKIYPAAAKNDARPFTQAWREFGRHWPYTVPLRLQEYCEQHRYPMTVYGIKDHLPPNTYYPVALDFFNFDIDYFDILLPDIKIKLHDQSIKILFYYHEGDNPRRIKSRLDYLCQVHGLHYNVYKFITSNTSAQELPGFVVFHDFEFWYYQRNQFWQTCKIHNNHREKDFTVLNRLHKSWRATIMAGLKSNNLLDNSYWSYGEPLSGDLKYDNPIEIDLIPGMDVALSEFLPPYACDDLSTIIHNDHHHLVKNHFENSYCNIVLESQFDVDQSGGVFLTEKTFKPIKHGQLFFIAGAARSLQTLRNLGYRVFDSSLDNSYDEIENCTDRYQSLLNSIKKAMTQGLHNIYQACISDIQHNQQVFMASHRQRLNNLSKALNENS